MLKLCHHGSLGPWVNYSYQEGGEQLLYPSYEQDVEIRECFKVLDNNKVSAKLKNALGASGSPGMCLLLSTCLVGFSHLFEFLAHLTCIC